MEREARAVRDEAVAALRRGASVVVVGDRGSGRTSLLRAVRQALVDGGVDVATGGGLELLRGDEFVAVGRAVRELPDGDAEGWLRTKVSGRVMLVDDVDLADAASLAVLLAVARDVPVLLVVDALAAVAPSVLATLGPDGIVVPVVGRAGDRGDGRAGEAVRQLPTAARGALVALAIAGGTLPTAALVHDGLAALSARGFVVERDPWAVATSTAALDAAVAVASEDELRVARRAVAPYVAPLDGARHLLASGDLTAAHDLAASAAKDAGDVPLRADLLTLAASTADATDPLHAEAASAALDAGRPRAAIGILSRADPSARPPDVEAAARRLSGLDDPAEVPAAEVVRRALSGDPSWVGGPVEDVHPLERGVALVVAAVVSGASDVAAAQAHALADGMPAGAEWRTLAEAMPVVVSLHVDGACQGAADALAGTVHPAAVAHRALALADLGRTSDAVALAEEAAAAATGSLEWLVHWIASEVHLVAGRLTTARVHAATARAAAPLPALAVLAELPAAWADIEAGGLVLAGAAPASAPLAHAAAEELAGVVALAAGAYIEAVTRFDAARARWEGISFRHGLRCAWAAGDAARRGGAPADAVARLRLVEAAAASRSMLPMVARTRTSLRRLGERPSTTDLSVAGERALLSSRERDVLVLVGEGLASQEIALRLGTARSTVETQISSAMAKLGARTRVQAVALARQREAR